MRTVLSPITPRPRVAREWVGGGVGDAREAEGRQRGILKHTYQVVGKSHSDITPTALLYAWSYTKPKDKQRSRQREVNYSKAF